MDSVDRLHVSQGTSECKQINGVGIVPSLFFALLVFCLVSSSPPASAQTGADVMDYVTVKFSGFRLNRRTGTFDSVARITNTSDATLAAPLSLVLEDISAATVFLANASGLTDTGRPYIEVLAAGELKAGEAIDKIVLKFYNPGRTRFSFQHRVLGKALLSCRDYFFAQKIVEADDCFQSELATEPTDEEANLFRALSRLLRLVEDKADGPNPAVFTDSFNELLEQFGVPTENLSVFDFDPDFPKPLPSDSPTGVDIQEFIRTVLIPEITSALEDNLSNVGSSYSTFVTEEELESFGIMNEPQVEVDYGDVKLLEAALRTALASLKSFVLAYDWDLDIDETALLDPLVLQDVVDANPALLTLQSDAATLLAQAKAALSDGIDAYYEGSDFIRNFDDPDQSDDLFAILPKDLSQEEEFRVTLGETKCSLIGKPLQGITDTSADCEDSGTPTIMEKPTDLTQFFDDPFALRSKLPAFDYDMDCDFNFVDVFSPTPTSPFPDPSVNGVFPGITQDGLIDMLGLPPEIEVFEFFFFYPVYAPAGGSEIGWAGDARRTDDAPFSPRGEVNLSLADGTVFSISDWFGDSGILCKKDDWFPFEYYFSPVVDGGFTDTLIIETNDPDVPLVNVPLKGCTGSVIWEWDGVAWTPVSDCDNDGVNDDIDNCPDTPNADQSDSDDNGVGDACDST